MMDESKLYAGIEKQFAKHETVNHSAKEYDRGDVTTNSVEGFFGIFKRGMVGVYQHRDEQHFHRYPDEFTFRYNNHTKLGVEDSERAEKMIKAMDGKRLTYRRIGGQEESLEGVCSPGRTVHPPAARRFVTLDTMQYVVRPKEGALSWLESAGRPKSISVCGMHCYRN